MFASKNTFVRYLVFSIVNLKIISHLTYLAVFIVCRILFAVGTGTQRPLAIKASLCPPCIEPRATNHGITLSMQDCALENSRRGDFEYTLNLNAKYGADLGFILRFSVFSVLRGSSFCTCTLGPIFKFWYCAIVY